MTPVKFSYHQSVMEVHGTVFPSLWCQVIAGMVRWLLLVVVSHLE